jgi:NAD(P)-dependent dehydrogenase (short-subunit alcohol dehydrogenase family)
MSMKKVVLVTGANRGIGLEICRQLADLGHTVILTARDVTKGESAAESIRGDVRFIQLDVTSNESANRCAIEAQGTLPHLDVLINNAAIIKPNPDQKAKSLRNAALEEVQVVFDTNFFGALRVTQALLPMLLKSPEGRIINMSSGMGELRDLSYGGYAAYRLSKAGLNAQTILLAADLSATHIKVNAMCPGWVRTDMGGRGATRSVVLGAETAVWLALAENIPSGRFWRDKREIHW